MYKYTNCELTPQVFEEALLHLFTNKQFTREECCKAVQDYHILCGGICNRKKYTDTFKKATQTLRKKGYRLENPIQGVWRLYNNISTTSNNMNSSTDDDIKKDIGCGEETVYCYYFPTYKKYAMMCSNNTWACKIGMTTKNIWDRIYSQSTTCFPEEPFVALIIHCENSKELEQLLHKVLKTRGKWIETSPGQEWYMTNPAEVESIYLWIVNGN